VTERISFECHVHFPLHNWLLYKVPDTFILPGLDHHVKVVSRSIHVPEVLRQCKDVFLIIQLDRVVVGLIPILALLRALLLNFARDRLVTDFPRDWAAILNEKPPLIDPLRTDNVVGQASVSLDLDAIIPLHALIYFVLFLDSSFRVVVKQLRILRFIFAGDEKVLRKLIPLELFD